GGGQQLVAIEHATAQELGERGYVLIPRYEAKAAAGVGTVVHSEQIVDYLAFKETWIREHLGLNPRLLLVLEALGDSMRPTIEDGDILLIDISEQHVRDNSIYVLVFGDELVVKRVERLRDGSVKIKSDNPAYGVETVPPGEVEKLWVVGRVRWSGGRV
ncbi:MAG: helix-turn-helix transcriptional regulator, partial [Rhodospirillales bacterium]|nr:helix-turn-helix transcriptional regulator [Rhodospirillales bacterium]